MKRGLLIPQIVLWGFLLLAAGRTDAATGEALRLLWDVPTKEVVGWTTKAYNQGGVRVEEIYYYSRYYKNSPVRIFGYYIYPVKHNGKLPAILLSHGGGGLASRPRAAAWAKRGYAVLAIDLPGKGENRSKSRSTGPDMDVPTLLRTQPDPSLNYLVHAAAAARNGITYLTQRPEVDPDRIGMIGLSWGGVLTLLTNGQDSRLKAAVNVFGAGFIPEGCTWEDRFFAMSSAESKTWNDLIDPKNFLASQHAPILFITGTNDHCYYLPTFQKSYEEVTVDKDFWLVPNLKHKFQASAANPALAWLDQKLKKGGSFPEISELEPIIKSEQIIIPASFSLRGPVRDAKLYYSLGGPSRWTEKKWLAIKGQKDKALYYFALPTKLLKPEALYYISVKDQFNGAAATMVRSLFRVKLNDSKKAIALSSAINEVFIHEPPIKLLNINLSEGDYVIKYLKNENVYSAVPRLSN